MKTYVIVATAIPTSYNRPKTFRIQAELDTDAIAILKDKLGDIAGVKNYVLSEPVVYVPPPPGRVLEEL